MKQALEHMPVAGPLPQEWESYALLRLGLTWTETQEIPHETAMELLAINAVVKRVEQGK